MTNNRLESFSAESSEVDSAVALTPSELDAKVSTLSYEDARSKLVEIVSQLEQGNLTLAETVSLWELGEALARRCETWLDGARERLNVARAAQQETPERETPAS
ncbi:MAG: exodeoxyribonuclease VII small subunit [Arcanobacterium sp.]|nr:exodeoxyribonuclease VII small subunit [Arcanobacterium sp.]